MSPSLFSNRGARVREGPRWSTSVHTPALHHRSNRRWPRDFPTGDLFAPAPILCPPRPTACACRPSIPGASCCSKGRTSCGLTDHHFDGRQRLSVGAVVKRMLNSPSIAVPATAGASLSRWAEVRTFADVDQCNGSPKLRAPIESACHDIARQAAQRHLAVQDGVHNAPLA